MVRRTLMLGRRAQVVLMWPLRRLTARPIFEILRFYASLHWIVKNASACDLLILEEKSTRRQTVAPKATGIPPLQIFESVVIRLYDGGVLSPAVLERVIGAFAQADVDWHDTVQGRSVDGRSLHEIVALTMLPGQPVRSASASFMSVIEHIASVAPHSDTSAEVAHPKPTRRKKAAPHANEAESESEELLAQLSGTGRSSKGRRSNQQDRPASSRGYNPFVNAQPPRSKKS